MRFVTKRLRWIGVGVGLGWFFDPRLGATRRAQARATATRVGVRTRAIADRVVAALPDSVRSRVDATLARIPRPGSAGDRALAERVRSEVLIPAGAGHLRVETCGGRVEVSGVLADPSRAAEIDTRVRALPDVVQVEVAVEAAAEGCL